MTTLSVSAPPIGVLKPLTRVNTTSPTMNASEQARRATIKKTAEAFEASFLSSALGSMSEGVTVSEPFGGGQGEKMFRSFLNDAMARQIVKKGGIGVAPAVEREMLKMQGLTPEPVK